MNNETDQNATIEEILYKGGRKKILSIDGGGIRGIIALEVLVQIENSLCNNSKKCLADYFDLIGGTSTGAIIAAGLAVGMKSQEILKIYKEEGASIFQKDCNFCNLISAMPLLNKLNFLKTPIRGTRYSHCNLRQILKKTFDDTHLNDDVKLKTKLLIPTKNMTLGKNYIFTNIKDIDRDKESSNYYVENEELNNIKLVDIILASSAAPTYFPPHQFRIKNTDFEFCDGAISMYNNPSFLLFLQASNIRKDYHEKDNWISRPDNLLLISIGNGFYDRTLAYGKGKNFFVNETADFLFYRLLEDANISQNHLLKLIGYEPYKWNKNEKTMIYTPLSKAMEEEQDIIRTKRMTYFRFNIKFNKERFEKLGLNSDNLRVLESLDCVSEIERLSEIGKAVGKEQFDIEKFVPFF